MIRPGEVRAIRELHGDRKGVPHRVQAEVCLGASTERGTAVVQVETHTPAVMKALRNLQQVIATEAMELTIGILRDQESWERELSQKKASK